MMMNCKIMGEKMKGMILTVDSMGYPVGWLTPQEAVAKYASNDVLWELGSQIATFRSGKSKLTGSETIISPSSIIGVKGQVVGRVPENIINLRKSSRKILFQRDRHICAYCGDVFGESDLTKDHINPISKGGKDVWMNVVTACRNCNQKKADKLPHEANMELLYAPYSPSRIEVMILRNRRILADQMEFLLERVPKHSRLKAD